MEHSTDEYLWGEIKSGNEKAFIEVYNRYRPMLLRDAYYKIRDYSEAEDIVQDVFTSLWIRRKELKIDAPLRIYLFKAVHFQFTTKLRKQQRANKYIKHSIQIKSGEILKATSQLESRELGHQIENALNAISPASRQVFKMQYQEGRKPKEIAEQMHITLQVARNHVSRALKILRTKLKEID